MTRATRYLIPLAIAMLWAAPLAAQQIAPAKCAGGDAVGYIGISGIDCNCTISTPGSGKDWSFRTEPEITSLEMDSRAAAVLRVGDVITSVNGKLITTYTGAQELAGLKPGVPVVLGIRRDGQALTYALTPESVCQNDTRLLGIYAPGRPSGVAPRIAAPGMVAPAETPPATPQPSLPRAWVGSAPITPAPGGYASAIVAPRGLTTPRVSFGMGLSCSNCGMQYSEKDKTSYMWFTRPPEVYSVERGGPADKAGITRGDLITHINSKRIDSSEGGKTFATAKPGQIVGFTVVRNNSSKVYRVKAERRASVATARPTPQLAQSSRALDEARQSLARLQRSQTEQMQRLQTEIRRSQQTQEDQLRRAQQQMLREEQVHRQRLEELASQMARANVQMRAALADSARGVCVTPAPAPAAAARASRTLRYSGTLGGSEIEVRGANPVSVTETNEEVVITSGATVVRIKKAK